MTQSLALDILLSGRNAFLTGSPGSGKTYLLNKFINACNELGKTVAITATTGIAATHISGQTINSWAGIGLGRIRKATDQNALKERFRKTDVLVIDEISMMSSKIFDMIDILAKIHRKSSDPFGGMQIILVGDFFQLPPVTKKEEKPRYVFKSLIWSELNLVPCYLNDQHRQLKDDNLSKILHAIRNGKFGKIEQKIVSTRQQHNSNFTDIIHLYTHNYDVDVLNNQKLDQLPGSARSYLARESGDASSLEILKQTIQTAQLLELKKDSEVMFVVNQPAHGYVNGSRGRVVELNPSDIVVKVYGGGYIVVSPHEFKIDAELYPKAAITQLPIKLAWGLTVHKSQGMTLEKAEIDLSHAFTPNMGYVALSRLISIEGLFLRQYNSMAFLINNDVRSIDDYLKKSSDAATKKLLHK